MKKIIISLFDETGNWPCGFEQDPRFLVKRYDLRHHNKENRCDVRLLTPGELKEGGHMVWGILSAAPCTVFASSGARWDRTEKQMLEGLSCIDATFRLIYTLKPVFWALENPVGTLRHYIGDPAWSFNPYDFGDPYPKKTYLWGRFNIPEKYQVPVENPNKIHHMTGGKDTQRSITPEGFSVAFYRANCEPEQFPD